MYKIGEISKIVDLPVKTLRYYDELEILKPAKIDDFTGYRFYDDDSIVECELIKILKSVGFTLDEIKEYKNDFSEEVLLNKKIEMEAEMRFLHKKYDRLQQLIKEAKETQRPIKVYKKVAKECEEEVKLRRKYEKRNIREYL